MTNDDNLSLESHRVRRATVGAGDNGARRDLGTANPNTATPARVLANGDRNRAADPIRANVCESSGRLAIAQRIAVTGTRCSRSIAGLSAVDRSCKGRAVDR